MCTPLKMDIKKCLLLNGVEMMEKMMIKGGLECLDDDFLLLDN